MYCRQTRRKRWHVKALRWPSKKSKKRLRHQTLWHRHFYPQTLLHTDAFPHKSLLHRNPFHRQTLWHADAFAHTLLYTQTFFHTDIFSYRRFYTQTLLHIWRFYTQTLLDTNAFTHRRCYTQTLLQPNVLDTNALTHTHTQTHTHTRTDTRCSDRCCDHLGIQRNQWEVNAKYNERNRNIEMVAHKMGSKPWLQHIHSLLTKNTN